MDLKADAKWFLQHIFSGLKIVQALPSVQAIEDHFSVSDIAHVAQEAIAAAPSFPDFIKKGVVEVEALIAKGPALYAFSKVLNAKSADQAFFDQRIADLNTVSPSGDRQE